MRSGLFAEFATAEELLSAIHAMHRKGYRRMDAFVPHPFHGLEEALRLPRSGINLVVGPLGIAMAIGGYGFQWYCNVLDYPIDVGGRPPHSPLAFVPITFETGVLWTSILAMVALFLVARLTALHHPVFDLPGFERASIDRYWLGVDERDRMFNRVSTAEDLTEQRPLRVAGLGIEPR